MALDSISTNSAITACLCANISNTPSMMVLDSFTAFFCNTAENHEGRQLLENVMINRWRDQHKQSQNRRCVFVTRDRSNLGIVKVLFINAGFSASFLFGSEQETGKETMTIRAQSRTTVMTLSKAIAALDLAIDGRASRDHVYAVKGKIETLTRLGFKIERLGNE